MLGSPLTRAVELRRHHRSLLPWRHCKRQINELKQKTIKLSRMAQDGAMGLVDSGATHPLRPTRCGENIQELQKVQVTLASGAKTTLHMTKKGCMVTADQTVEPIVPMGILVDQGCSISWEGGCMKLIHPVRGELPVDTASTGCPQVEKSLALELIEEWEQRTAKVAVKSLSLEERSGMTDWMRELVMAHPTLRQLPEAIRSRLVVEPTSWSDLPGNSKSRRRWRKRGMTVHLYSGPDEGYTLTRALRKAGGEGAQEELLEVDLQRGHNHDMLKDQGVYSGLLNAALENKVKAVIAGPNCRTRSVLRHRPLPEVEDQGQSSLGRGHGVRHPGSDGAGEENAGGR